jgi:hypothetical protein
MTTESKSLPKAAERKRVDPFNSRAVLARITKVRLEKDVPLYTFWEGRPLPPRTMTVCEKDVKNVCNCAIRCRVVYEYKTEDGKPVGPQYKYEAKTGRLVYVAYFAWCGDLTGAMEIGPVTGRVASFAQRQAYVYTGAPHVIYWRPYGITYSNAANSLGRNRYFTHLGDTCGKAEFMAMIWFLRALLRSVCRFEELWLCKLVFQYMYFDQRCA